MNDQPTTPTGAPAPNVGTPSTPSPATPSLAPASTPTAPAPTPFASPPATPAPSASNPSPGSGSSEPAGEGALPERRPHPGRNRPEGSSASSEGTPDQGTRSSGGADSGSDGGDAGSAGEPGSSSGSAAGSGTGTGPKRRRRGKRGGQRHRSGGSGGTNADGTPRAPRPSAQGDPGDQADLSDRAAEGADGARDAGDGEAATPRPRAPRPPRPPRQPRPEGSTPRAQSSDGAASEAAGDAAGGEPTAAGDATTGTASSSNKRRRRRRSGSKTGANGTGSATKTPKTGEDGAAPTAPAKEPRKQLTSAELAAAGATRLAARKLREEQRKQRGKGRRPRRMSEEEAAVLKGKPKTMLIHDHEDRTQIAILEEGELIEHYVSRRGQRASMVGNVYMGKVQNVIVGMEAAFVDFGRGRNGILYANEITYTDEDLEGDIPRIENALKAGQKIMVQVTKDPIGTKGARLSTNIALAGRYLVLAPEQQAAGVSRRLSDKERMRLRKILKDIDTPSEHGVIIRTAADGASEEAIRADLSTLLKQWTEISSKAKGAKPPTALYEEPELIMRVVRDIFQDDFELVVVDTRDVFDEIRGYLQEAAPDLVDKVKLHEGALPLFEERRVSEQLHKSLERKVWLPSGGSLIWERTEAMTVIDVNTGKFTGGKGTNLEEVVFKNNVEAAQEIARQLRLRDVGGIIIIDFIDMIDTKNQREVIRTLKTALQRDKTKSQVFEVSSLGLVEMTRKRVSEGLVEAFSESCPNCEGRGLIVNHRMD